MDDFITIYYWVRLAVLVAVVLIGLVTAIRMSGRRTFRPWREVLFAVLAIVLFGALAAIAGVTFGPLWGGVLGFVGLLAGFFTNRGARVSNDGGRAVVRSSALAPWVWFVAVTVTLAALLFAESYVFALSMLLLAFAVGAVVGQSAGLVTGSKEAPVRAPEVSTV